MMSNFVEKESDFSNMVNARLSRRGFLMGTAAAGAGAFLALNPVAKAIAGSMDNSLLNFEAITTSTSDSILLPKGYSSSTLMSWGTQSLRTHLNLTLTVSKTQKHKRCNLVIIPMV